ncbi:MAG TPA: hypothetical protein VG797_09010 [Phycisphaerales bacterium]|nr:hypothetical protein [Phycisphaerales bacterium]
MKNIAFATASLATIVSAAMAQSTTPPSSPTPYVQFTLYNTSGTFSRNLYQTSGTSSTINFGTGELYVIVTTHLNGGSVALQLIPVPRQAAALGGL